jgi:hypothetical protein
MIPHGIGFLDSILLYLYWAWHTTMISWSTNGFCLSHPGLNLVNLILDIEELC